MKAKSTSLRTLLVLLLTTLLGTTRMQAQEAYAFYDSSTNTLTFCYDTYRSTHTGTGIKTYDLNSGYNDPGWVSDGTYHNVQKVIFNSSFSGYSPFSTCKWFFKMTNLTQLVGFDNLYTRNTKNMSQMFQECGLEEIEFTKSIFFTYNTTDMGAMFSGCKFKKLDLSPWTIGSNNTAKVTNMQSMFSDCDNLETVILTGEAWNTATVTNMISMFSGCFKLTTICVDNGWNTSNVSTDINMFYSCYNLVGYNGTEYNESNITKTYARVDGGTSAPGYLTNCLPYAVQSDGTLTFYCDGQRASRSGTTYDLNYGSKQPGWYGSSITNVVFDLSFTHAHPNTTYYWFAGMNDLTSIQNMEYLNTSRVYNMGYMFSSCKKLSELDLTNFETAQVTDMLWMFGNCTALTRIYVSSGWDVSNVTRHNPMFSGSSNLVGGAGTAYSSSHVDKTYARVDGGPSSSTPGYLSFTPYAVYDNGTLSFYFDANRNSRTGTKYSLNAQGKTPGWYEKRASVTNVVFDASFADACPLSTRSWFYGMENLTNITGIQYLNTAEVTEMYCMFYKCSQLVTLDLSGFNTSKVTDMRSMFRGCHQLKIIYISPSWKTTNVTSSSNMFYDLPNIVGGGGTKYSSENTDKTYARRDLGPVVPGYFSYIPYAVYTSNNLTVTFYSDGKQSEKTGSVFTANADGSYGRWDTVENTIDPSVVNATKVVFDVSYRLTRPTSTYGMFHGLSKLRTITDIKYLKTDEVTNMIGMFWGYKGTELNLMTFNTKKVTKFGSMFSNCSNLTTIYAANWNTQAEGTTSTSMFYGCSKLVGGAGTTYSVTNGSYAHIDGGTDNPGYFTALPYVIHNTEAQTLTFYNDGLAEEKTGDSYSLNEGTNSPGWANDRLTTTKAIFDPSFADVRPTTTYQWFDQFSELITIEGMEYLNTSEVTNMGSMFWNCKKLTSVDLSHFNTKKVTNMRNMFGHCESMTSLNLNSFNTENVTDMNYMFGQSAFTELDLSSFNTQNVTNMGSMFSSCASLKTIVVDRNLWSTANVTTHSGMFSNCTQLVGGAGTPYNSSYTNKTYARIDGGTNSPGYLTNGAKEEYAVWDAATHTLTHYYDWKKSMRTGEIADDQGYWTGDEQDFPMAFDEVVKVVYDPSIATYGGTILEGWKCGGYTNLTTIEGLEYMDTSKETYFAGMFNNCSSLTTLDLSSFDTRKATNMSYMFNGCTRMDNLILGENFSTENVTNMSYMLGNKCFITALRTVITHENFSTENVTDMSGMFTGIQGTNLIDLVKFNTAKVTNMNRMFEGCSSLTTIYVGFDWSTESVTTSSDMFKNCTNLVGGAGTAFNSNNVTAGYAHIDGGTASPGYFSGIVYTPYAILDETTATLSFYADGREMDKEGTLYYLPNDGENPGWYLQNASTVLMNVVFDPSFITARPTSTNNWFAEMLSLSEIEGLEYLITSEVTDMQAMFANCQSLTTLDLTKFDTQNVTNMKRMFWGCNSLKAIYVGGTWTLAKVTNTVNTYGMFYNCSNLVGSAGTVWEENVHGQTNTNLKPYAHIDGGEDNPGLLSGKTEAYVLKSTDFKTVTFYYDAMRLLRDGTIYDLNTGSVRPGWDDYRPTWVTTVIFDPSFAEARPTSTYQWFYNMTNLLEIEGIEYLNTSEVTTMNGMFHTCRSLQSLDLSNFDTQKVTDMGAMFRACTALKDLDLSSFNTSRRMNFNWMFGDCTSLEVLDLSSFNTSAVYNMANLFNGCTALKTIYVGDEWNAQDVSTSTQMFNSCTSLVGGAGTTYDVNHVDKAYAIIDGTNGNPGYLTYKGAYVVYDANSTTLTFYCDTKKGEKTGTIYSLNQGTDAPAWYTDGTCGIVTKVVFDSSFADARPTTTEDWFVAMFDLASIEGMQYLNTSEVTNMMSMFSLCRKLESVDVTGFDTRKVTTMHSMFNECNALKILDLSSFNTSLVTDMNNMFSNCTSLTTIYVKSNWNEGFSGSSSFMFTNCTNLVGGAGTKWDSSRPVDISYAQIDGGEIYPGYFTQGPPPSSLGDVNKDEKVNVADVTALVNMLNTGNVNYNKVVDVDGNGRVDEQDVKALVNLILGNAPSAIVLNYQVKAKPNNNYEPIMIDVDQRICDAFGLTVDQISDKIQCEFSSVVEDGCIMIYNYNDDGTFCTNDYNVGDNTPGYWLNNVGDIRYWSSDDVVGAVCFSKDNKKFFIYQYPNRIESGDTMKYIFGLRYNNGGEMTTVGLTFNLTFSNEIDEDVVTLH